ncbi:MAG: hypothetical protein EZS28_031335, partial [Streblomastix strix]
PNIVNDNQPVIKGRQPSDKLDPDVTARLLELSQPITFEKATGIYTPLRPPAPCSAASASFASVMHLDHLQRLLLVLQLLDLQLRSFLERGEAIMEVLETFWDQMLDQLKHHKLLDM